MFLLCCQNIHAEISNWRKVLWTLAEQRELHFVTSFPREDEDINRKVVILYNAIGIGHIILGLLKSKTRFFPPLNMGDGEQKFPHFGFKYKAVVRSRQLLKLWP